MWSHAKRPQWWLESFVSFVSGATALVVVFVTGTAVRVRAQSPADSPYERYRYPGQCVQAVTRLTRLYWRDKRSDTLTYTPETDTLPTAVRAAAGQCAERFSPAHVAPSELLSLTQLYLAAGRDDLAREAADRLVRPESGDAAWRALMLQDLVSTFLTAMPSRVALTRTYLAALDSLGNTAAFERFESHVLMLHYALGEDDLASAVLQGRDAVTAASRMPRDDQIGWLNDIERAYTALAEVTGLQLGRMAAAAVLDTAKLRITPILPATDRWTPQTLRNIQQFLDAERAVDSMAGVAAPLVHGDYWYNTGDDSSTRPRHGRVSVMAIMPSGFAGAYYPEYAVLKRLQGEYAARGVDFIIMTFTTGSFRDHLIPRPAAEAEVLKGWFLDYLKLSVALAVEQSQFGYLRDGRRQGHPMTNYKNYAFIRNASLIGKDGKIEFIEMLTPDRERLWRSAIDEALK